jgi:CheY-like chemotaxis protein
VLVVEDDPAIREWLRDALTDEGYAVEAAGTGRAALARLTAWRPRLILLDLKMPDLDGWGFRAAQLADPAIAGIPVVVMTAMAGAGAPPPEAITALAPAALLRKPFDLEELLDTVLRFLESPPGTGPPPGTA